MLTTADREPNMVFGVVTRKVNGKEVFEYGVPKYMANETTLDGPSLIRWAERREEERRKREPR